MIAKTNLFVLLAAIIVTAVSPAASQLHVDPDTGKEIADGFDIRVFAQVPGSVYGEMRFGPGGAFGNDLYVLGGTEQPGNIYRVNSYGQVTQFATPPIQMSGMAFSNSGSSFGEYLYLGSGESYYAGNQSIYRMDSAGNVEKGLST